jgi:hypothetical protein
MIKYDYFPAHSARAAIGLYWVYRIWAGIAAFSITIRRWVSILPSVVGLDLVHCDSAWALGWQVLDSWEMGLLTLYLPPQYIQVEYLSLI